MPTSTLGHSPVRPLPPPSGGNPIDNIPTAEQLLDAWRLFKQHSPPYLARTSPGDIVLFVQQLDELRALCCAAHPDACQVCREAIVPEDERICKCAGRTCLSCAGKAGVCCPHCRSSDVLPLIAIDKVPLTFSALMRSDFKGIKPELVSLQKDARARLEEEEAGEIVGDDDDGDGGDFVAAQAQELARIERANRRRRRDAQPPPEDSEQSKEQPPPEEQPKEQDEPRAKRQRPDEQQKKQKEDKASKEINALLDLCAKHNDQRTFKELFVDLNDTRQWNQRQMGNLAPAHTMDLKTIREQWFVTANMCGLGKEMRFLGHVRLGEFYEQWDHRAAEGKLGDVDDKGNAQHYSNALDYARRALGGDKKYENHLRSCHQFFTVWKEWHPIIAVAQSEVSWSTLQEMLTKNKLLEAVRARGKAEPIIAPTPVPLPYAIPPRWRGQYRRPDNVAPMLVQDNAPTGRIALTFGERAESRAGGPMVGDAIAEAGFTVQELHDIAAQFQNASVTSLHDALPADVRSDNDLQAAVLLIKDGVRQLGVDPQALLVEQGSVEYDKMEYSSRFRRTTNSLARHNIVFGPERIEHSADYQQNTVASWTEVPLLAQLRGALNQLGPKAKDLNAEGNHYYDASKCGIGFHGDAERKIVVCASLGEPATLRYYWKAPNNTGHNSAAIDVQLQHGDIYIMSEKATGWDARTRSQWRLVHAAGAAKFIAVVPPAPRLVGVELNPGPTVLTRVTRYSKPPFVFLWWPSERRGGFQGTMDHEAREQLKSRFRVSGIISLKHIFFCEERLGSSALLDAGDLPRSCLRGLWGRWPLSQEDEVQDVLHKARVMLQEKEQRERKRLMLMELRQRELQRLRREQIHLVLFLMMRAYRAVPAPRLVGVELNPGPPLSSLLSVVKFQEPPAEFIAECRKEMAQSNPDALSEYLIRLVFTTGMLQQSYNQGVHAFNEQNQQLTAARAAMNTLPDPRVVDTKADAAALQAETEAWRNKKRDDFDKHHLVARQLLERRLHDFALSHKAAHQSSVIVHALDAIANEVQTREAAKVRSKAMMAQACQQADQAQQLRQQARALMSSAAAAPPAAIGLLK